MKDGGWAFPAYTGNGTAEPGMTLRDYFAAQALNRFARPTHPKHDPCHQLGINAKECIAWDAKVAYAYADAMLAERERDQEEEPQEPKYGYDDDSPF